MIFEVEISLFLIVDMLRILSLWSGEPLQVNLLSTFSIQTPASACLSGMGFWESKDILALDSWSIMRMNKIPWREFSESQCDVNQDCHTSMLLRMNHLE